MARTAHRNLASKTVRAKLPPRRKAYFTTLERRLSLGYFRNPGTKAGRWIVQREIGRAPAGHPIHKTINIGTADDYTQADGVNVFSYEQALAAATRGELTSSTGPLTVRQAIVRYVEHLRAHNGETAAKDAESKLRRHVLREDIDGKPLPGALGLGAETVAKLTLTQLGEWLGTLIHRKAGDPDAERRSKDTANRVLGSFKAALNLAFQDDKNKIPTDKPWRVLKGFKDVGARREDHFAEAQVASLIKGAKKQDPCFADLVEAAFHTGARPPGELARLDVKHFHAQRGQIQIIDGKTGPRITTLAKEGVEFFKRITKGKKPGDILLPRADGERWGKSQHFRPMRAALAAADLPDTAGIYTIRHTYISRAIENGMPLTLIAENVGTSVQMIEKNYGKFIAQTRRDLIERTAPRLQAAKRGKPHP